MNAVMMWVLAVAASFSSRTDAGESVSAKARLIDQMITEAEQRSGGAWAASARQNVRQTLQGLPAEAVAKAAEEGGNALGKLLGGESLGSALNEWVFVPLPPCRLLDTRPASGSQGAGAGPLAPGSAFPFEVARQCGIPFVEAKAASLNVIAVAATGNGHFRLWPWDSSNPAAPPTAVLNFTQGFNTSNALVVPICNVATATGGSCTKDLFVEPFLNSAHVAIDAVGYFRPATTIASVESNGGQVSIAGPGATILTSCTITNGTTTTRGVIANGTVDVLVFHQFGLDDKDVSVYLTNNSGSAGNSVADFSVPITYPSGAIINPLSGIKRFSLAPGQTGTYFLAASTNNPGGLALRSTIHCVLDQ